MGYDVTVFKQNLSKEKSQNISIPVFCFCALFLIFLLRKTYLFHSEQVLQFFDYLEWPIYIFAFLSWIFNSSFEPKDIAKIVAVGSIFSIVFFVNGLAELLKAMILVVVMSKENYQKIIILTNRLLVFSVFLTLTLYVTGISDAMVQRRNATALGYFQANAVGFICLFLTIYAFQIKPVRSLWMKLLLISVTLIAYILSQSRTGCTLAILVIVLSNQTIYSLIHRHKSIQFFLSILPCICFALTIGASLIYPTNKFIQSLDDAFMGRIWMNYYELKMCGFTPFGTDVIQNGGKLIENPVTHQWTSYMTIDCAYVAMIISMGIVTVVLVCILYFVLSRKLIEHRAYATCIALSAICIYGITESSIISIYVCIPFLLLYNKNPNSWKNQDVFRCK